MVAPTRNRIAVGDALQLLRRLDPSCVNLVVTSPPYWALRNYGSTRQIGAEPDFDDYLAKLWTVFDEVRRVLRPDGTCWVNLGDTYATPGTLTGQYGHSARSTSIIAARTRDAQGGGRTSKVAAKSLIGIPERFMLGMLQRGWILRNKVVWRKTRHMPTQAKDRFASSWEYVYLFARSRRYHFDLDALREPHRRPKMLADAAPPDVGGMPVGDGERFDSRDTDPTVLGRTPADFVNAEPDVWELPTARTTDAHFAVFPLALAERAILTSPREVCTRCGKAVRRITRTLRSRRSAMAGPTRATSPKPEIGYVTLGWARCRCAAPTAPALILDPFMGSGTTAVAARRHGRDYLGFELNPEYAAMARRRLKNCVEGREDGAGAKAA